MVGLLMKNTNKKIKEMIRIENYQASNISNSVKGIKNEVVSKMLKGIAYDSKKHADFYYVILNQLENKNPSITVEDYKNLKEIIEKHIEIELQMMEEVKKLLQNKKNSKVKYLLNEIYTDEHKHHILMENILESVIKKETFFEEDRWEKIWEELHSLG
jgi:rubrerythrin